MNIYTCTQFTGHYPVGTAAVVLAWSREEAAERLNDTLRSDHNLPGDVKPEDMVLFQTYKRVRVLNDGNY